MDVAARLFKLFAGYERAHGTYIVPKDAKAEAGKKIKGRAKTVYEPATIQHWKDHLAGTVGLGITPIHADANCSFGALDIDVYNLDLPALNARMLKQKLPFVLCRTKSGGAHLYVFFKTPVPAGLLRFKLREWSQALDYGKCEVFPKQEKVEREDDAGSWINMPYIGGELSLRYAMGADGSALTIEQFIDYAASMAVTNADALEAIDARNDKAVLSAVPVTEIAADLLMEGPPCLQSLGSVGFPEGSRNNGIFSLAVYVRKRWKDESADGRLTKLLQLNEAFMLPPLPYYEVLMAHRSVERKDYGYKCKDEPIASCCDKKTCVKRTFGVAGGKKEELGLSFGDLSKVMTQPVRWIWDVDGAIVAFDTADLMTQKLFHAKMIEYLNVWPPLMKNDDWRDMVQKHIANASILNVPDDATVIGQLWGMLSKFCTSRVAGRSKDELLIGKPFSDEVRSYFVLGDFLAFLAQNKFSNKMTEREIFLEFSKSGLQSHREELKGKILNFWSVPALSIQNKEHDVPREAPKDVM